MILDHGSSFVDSMNHSDPLSLGKVAFQADVVDLGLVTAADIGWKVQGQVMNGGELNNPFEKMDTLFIMIGNARQIDTKRTWARIQFDPRHPRPQ